MHCIGVEGACREESAVRMAVDDRVDGIKSW